MLLIREINKCEIKHNLKLESNYELVGDLNHDLSYNGIKNICEQIDNYIMLIINAIYINTLKD